MIQWKLMILWSKTIQDHSFSEAWCWWNYLASAGIIFHKTRFEGMKRCFDVWCFFREFPTKNGALFGLVILLMEEILRQLIGSLSQEGFWHPRWCGFLPSTVQWPLYWFVSKLSGTPKNMIQFDSRALFCEKMVVANIHPLNSSWKKSSRGSWDFLLKTSPHLKNIKKFALVRKYHFIMVFLNESKGFLYPKPFGNPTNLGMPRSAYDADGKIITDIARTCGSAGVRNSQVMVSSVSSIFLWFENRSSEPWFC